MTYSKELLERCAGYYDGVHGVLFLDVATKEQRFTTDFHEGTHRWLAENSVLGDLYRFFSVLKQHADDDVPPDVLAEIESLVALLTRENFLPQEITATYMGLHACSRFHPDDFQAVADSLPQSYYDFYEFGLETFGPLDSGDTATENNRHAETVNYIAAAAMSPPAETVPVELDLHDLANLRAFVEANSGNDRFRRILENAVVPFGEPGLITDAVRGGLEMTEVPGFVYARIEKACPGLRIAKDTLATREWARVFFARLRDAVRELGSSALDRVINRSPVPEDDWGGATFTQELSTVSPHDGNPIPFFDTAITHLGHQEVGPEVIDALIELATRGAVVHAHLVPVVPDTDLAEPDTLPDGGCTLYGQILNPPDPIGLFTVPLTEEELHDLLDGMPRESLVLRARADLYPALRPLLGDHLNGRRMYLCVARNGSNDLYELMAGQPRSFVFNSTLDHPAVPDFLIQVLLDHDEVVIAATTPTRFELISRRLAETGRHTVLDASDDPSTSGVDVDELGQVVTMMSLGLL